MDISDSKAGEAQASQVVQSRPAQWDTEFLATLGLITYIILAKSACYIVFT